MSNKSELLAELQLAVIEGNQEEARQAAQRCLDARIPPLEAMETGLREGLRIVGEQFERLEVYLPEMIMAADAGSGVMEVLEPAIASAGQETSSPGTVIIGTAKADIHTIGKTILTMLLRLAGFKVFDLGEDVAATTFLEESRRRQADIIAISALMTSTMPGQRDVINLLTDVGEREKYAVMVGGAPVTQEWADKIGADGYSESASGAVKLALRLVDR